jgi:hypothetical protein
MWVIAILAGVFIFVNTQPIRPHDFWWHLALGREIVSTGNIPAFDVYSFTMPGEPYPSYQMFWLIDSALYSIYLIGGPALVVFIQSLLITAAYGLLLWLCRKIAGSWRIAVLATIFAVALGINNWNVRPQTISFLLGVLYLLAIYSYRLRPRWGWLAIFPIGMIIWVNSHGSFIIGLVLIGIWIGAEIWEVISARYHNDEISLRKSFWAAWISLGMALVASLINPRGLGIISYVRTLTGSQVVQNLVPEWASPSFNDIYGTIFLISLMLSAVVLAISPKRPYFFQIVTFLVFGILGLKTTRGVIWFGLVMAPIMADHLAALNDNFRAQESKSKVRAGSPVLNLTILIILIAAMLISLPWFKEELPFPRNKAGLISAETPLAATEYLLSEQVEGELFHDMGFGSYLIWAAHPDYRVFADPRIELYPRDLWWDYVAIANALPGWEDLLQKYEFNALMLNVVDQSALVNALGGSSNWIKIYQDSVAAIYVKDD